MNKREEPKVTPRRKARIEIEAEELAEISDARSGDEDEVEVMGKVSPLIWPLASGISSFVWSVRGFHWLRIVRKGTGSRTEGDDMTLLTAHIPSSVSV